MSNVAPSQQSVQSDFDFDFDDAETWRPIDGWPGYDISSWGQVRSFWGAAGKGRGQGRRGLGLTPMIFGGYVLSSGHRSVQLYRDNSREKRRCCVHILVLEAFVGPRPAGMWGLHNDGDPANNRAANLRWGTHSENTKDSVRHGTHNLAKLTEADVFGIWARLAAGGESFRAIGRDYGVTGLAIGSIYCGKAWSHVTRDLPGWPLYTPPAATVELPISISPEFTEAGEELWRIVPNWPAYRVSNRGRVQCRWERMTGVGAGRGAHRLGEDWKDKATFPDKDGYLKFSAYDGPGRFTSMKVHAAVLLAFAGPCPTGMVGCHNNGDRTDNHAGNLRWDTVKANNRERERHKAERVVVI